MDSSSVFHVIQNGVIYELEREPEGGFSISVPMLPGCLTYGKTFEEAMEMIVDAMEGWLFVARKRGVPIPEQFEQLAQAS